MRTCSISFASRRVTYLLSRKCGLTGVASVGSFIQPRYQSIIGVPSQVPCLSSQLCYSGLETTLEKLSKRDQRPGFLQTKNPYGLEAGVTKLLHKDGGDNLSPEKFKAWNSKPYCLVSQEEEDSRQVSSKLRLPSLKRAPLGGRMFSKASRKTFFPYCRLLSSSQRRNFSDERDSPDPESEATSSTCSADDMTKSEQREVFLLTGSKTRTMDPEVALKERIGTIFDKADTNADGQLSRAEFVAWYMNVCNVTEESSVTPEPPCFINVEQPTKAQLTAYSWRVMIPFFAFGFIDNFLMIGCGEFIDIGLSQKFACSMMISAGLGNTISDAIGVLGSDSIDRLATRVDEAIGTTKRTPLMTQQQLGLNVVKRRKTIFQTVGIVTGCLVGMFPLMFI